MRLADIKAVEDKCGLGAAACYRLEGSVCVIYTQGFKVSYGNQVEVENAYDFETMEHAGHELRHCFDGAFHYNDMRASESALEGN